jgi:hypothetical protein
MRVFKSKLTWALLLSLPFPVSALADCAGDVPQHLEWCSRDHGFNEGATCGLNALSEAGISGLPAVVAQPILGNIWDRTNMMGATKTAWKAGQHDKAIDAAVCCQIHNDGAHACLQSQRDLVAAWLTSKTQ